jgi:putative ABC transport system permease protein
MLLNYLKIAIKSLLRRKFFLAISLFGIGFTLTVLLVIVALLDHVHAPLAPEVNLKRTLHVSRVVFRGTHERGVRVMATAPGYALLDRYARDIPGVERMSVFSEAATVSGFIQGEKAEFQRRRADGVYWEILDFEFLEGAPFTRADEKNAHFVAVISEATRQRFFGNEPALDRSIEVDGQRFRAVGVVKDVASTRLAATGDIWVPLSTAKSQEYRERLDGGHGALLLAASTSDFPRIKAEYESRLSHVEPEPPFDTVLGTALTRFEETILSIADTDDGKPDLGKFIVMGLGMAAAFLLLPTVNLVSINITRILERSGEIGVRKAFGASSLHLVGQFITENVVLCLLGGLLSLAGAAATLELIEAAGWFPHAELGLNYRVFLYALALACGFGVLSGAFPAWRMSRLHPVAAIRGGAR